jgi:hypothetical protein
MTIFVGVLKKNISNRLALAGVRPTSIIYKYVADQLSAKAL